MNLQNSLPNVARIPRNFRKRINYSLFSSFIHSPLAVKAGGGERESNTSSCRTREKTHRAAASHRPRRSGSPLPSKKEKTTRKRTARSRGRAHIAVPRSARNLAPPRPAACRSTVSKQSWKPGRGRIRKKLAASLAGQNSKPRTGHSRGSRGFTAPTATREARRRSTASFGDRVERCGKVKP